VTPVASRCIAQACRTVGRHARVGMPRSRRAARKASCPRERGRGLVAVARPGPPRPSAGQIQSGGRWGPPDWRHRARRRRGRGTSRSLAPLPRRPWRPMRAESRALPCRGVPSCRRRPQASRVARQTRERGRGTPARMVRTSVGLRMPGRFCSRGGLTHGRVVHARGKVWGEKHVMPPRAMGRALRESCWTCLSERQESRRAASVRRSGDLWSCAAAGGQP
jgi:hypothetical protein